MNLLDPRLVAYAEARTAAEPAHLRRLSAYTYENHDCPQMLSGHLQGRLLSLLSRIVRPRRALEIGTFTGYSAVCLAEGLAPSGKLNTIEINPKLRPVIENSLDAGRARKKVKVHFGKALEIILTIRGAFDLVFIDADKTNYGKYFDAVIDRVRSGGLVIADNVLWSGRVLLPRKKQDRDTRALSAFARKLKRDPRVMPVLLPVRDGLLVAVKL